jgi:Domain of unknown function (DUF397)
VDEEPEMPEPSRSNDLEFRTSSFSDGGGCVEVGRIPTGGAIVRDSKDPARDIALSFNRKEWDAFVRGVKNGEFDPL